ncbi:response regulator transcription factor [Chondrinema litorale]|uniref:response regulator transcription factor n=1 Tax=Chondrinema litorale TaxID=2994555 RepID=UPI002543A03D|nr:response regulator transcription factor [Chondrinema litorale]UZR92998.1 response regulator transcription factor [Chondrinema litorale]
MMDSDKKAHILLVEDDESLGFIIKDNLEMNNLNVTLIQDGNEAINTLKEFKYDVCILDIMLPGKDGLSIAKEMQNSGLEIPFMFLSARSLKEDRIKGFRTGCDDYLTKPFNIEELLLRIEVILRRNSKNAIQKQSTYQIGDYLFDYKNQFLKYDDEINRLTQREAEILKILVTNRESLVKRSDILIQVWGDDDYFKGRSLDVFISKIRKYLKKDKKIKVINVHSSGFCLEIADFS